MRRLLPLLLASIGLGLAVPLLYGGTAGLHRLTELPPAYLLLGLGMVALAWLCNAARIRALSVAWGPPLALHKTLGTVLATEFANCVVPAGTGGPLTYLFVLTRWRIPATAGAALFATEQLFDLLFFISIVPLAAGLSALEGRDLHLGWTLAASSALLAASLGLIWTGLRHYRRLLVWAGPWMRRLRVSKRLRLRAARAVLRFRQGIAALARLPRRRLATVYLLCMVQWSLRYSVLWVILTGLGAALPWGTVVLAQIAVLVLAHATFLPGGSGGAEVGFSLLFAAWLDKPTLAAAVILWRFMTFYWYLLAGAPVFAALAGSAVLERISTAMDGIRAKRSNGS